MSRKKATAAPRRLYAWAPTRRASRACVKHFIAAAIEEKRMMAAKSPAWYRSACTISRQWHDDAARKSVKVIARDKLEYCRLRAHMVGTGASHCPVGWPLDRPAHDLWARLNPVEGNPS